WRGGGPAVVDRGDHVLVVALVSHGEEVAAAGDDDGRGVPVGLAREDGGEGHGAAAHADGDAGELGVVRVLAGEVVHRGLGGEGALGDARVELLGDGVDGGLGVR